MPAFRVTSTAWLTVLSVRSRSVTPTAGRFHCRTTIACGSTQWSTPGVLRMQYNYTWEHDGRVGFVRNLDDETLDRYYGYDHVGRLTVSRTGNEARLAINEQVPLIQNGPYSHGYFYDVWGNITGRRVGVERTRQYSAGYANNKMTAFDLRRLRQSNRCRRRLDVHL